MNDKRRVKLVAIGRDKDNGIVKVKLTIRKLDTGEYETFELPEETKLNKPTLLFLLKSKYPAYFIGDLPPWFDSAIERIGDKGK